MPDKSSSNVQGIFSQLHALTRLVGLYSANHPHPLKAMAAFHDTLTTYLASEDQLIYRFLEDLLVVNDRPLPRESLVYRRFLLHCQDKQRIGSITFLRGLERRETDVLVEALTTRVDGDWREWVARKQLHHILLSPPARTERPDGDRIARRAYGASVEALRKIQDTIRERVPVSASQIDSLRSISSTLMDQILLTPGLVTRLSSIKSYDEYTLYHSVNVAIISLGLGLVIGLPENLLLDVGLAGMLHDVGKSSIPLEILRKAGALEESEWQSMRQHPSFGAEILSHLPSTNRLPMISAFEHHMRFDQAGYPPLGKPWSQHPVSRIVCMADVFDAMTSRRTYKVAIPIEKVCSYTRSQANLIFDPRMVRILDFMLRQLGDETAEKEESV